MSLKERGNYSFGGSMLHGNVCVLFGGNELKNIIFLTKK